MFQAFDDYLASSFSVDYWSDEGIGIAAEKLTNFSSEDWQHLILSLENRESLWLVRCAEVLGDHEDKLAVEALMKIVVNENNDVQIAALDSINALLSEVSVDGDVLVKLKDIVRGIDSPSIVVKLMLDSLKNKIS